MEIRRATPDDYHALTTLEVEVQALHVEGAPDIYRPGGVLSRESYGTLMANPAHTVVLAIDNDLAVGYMHYEIVERPETEYTFARRILHVHALSIKEEQRRKGYGEALMDYAMQVAREQNAQRVTLDVAAFNKGAYAFYQRIGFQPAQIRMAINV
jgi:ribosomal protein S18 acetylase RimI-like enzyme